LINDILTTRFLRYEDLCALMILIGDCCYFF